MEEMIPIPTNLVDQVPEDWLPPGWIVKARIRRDGKRDRFYFSPSGERFNSKVGVCRYLGLDPKTIDHSPQPKTPCVQSNSSKVGPHLSPEVSAPKTTKKTICPSRKLVAPSTPAEKRQNRSRDSDSSLQKAHFERVPAEGLPPGWIKEIKIQKMRGKIRRDAYYTDPTFGYVFRSMKDSLRFIETGEPGRLAIIPKSPDEAKAVKLVGNKRKLQLGDSPVQNLEKSATVQKAGPIRKSGKKVQLGARSSKIKKEPSLPRRSSGRISTLKEKTEIQSNGLNDSREESKKFNQRETSSRGRGRKDPNKSHPYISSGDTSSILPRNTGSGDKSRSKSPLVLSYEESWLDPCIDFAVKTLTGTNPAGKDISVHDYIGQSQGDDYRTPPGFPVRVSEAKLNGGNWNTAELLPVKFGMSGNANVPRSDGSASRCNWVRGTDRSLFR